MVVVVGIMGWVSGFPPELGTAVPVLNLGLGAGVAETVILEVIRYRYAVVCSMFAWQVVPTAQGIPVLLPNKVAGRQGSTCCNTGTAAGRMAGQVSFGVREGVLSQ